MISRGVRGRKEGRRAVLNARRHRDGDQTRRGRRRERQARVLNARRHRDGDQNALAIRLGRWPECSTPGGIETVISCTARIMSSHVLCAQRPEASRR